VTFASSTLRVANPDAGNAFFVSAAAGSKGKGTKKKPWDLQTALSQPDGIRPGDTIYLRGGIYNGKFVSSLNGTPVSPITVRSYPGEWAVIDGYVTTSLSGAISSTQKTLNLADATKFPDGSVVTLHDQSDPGSEEQLMLPSRSGSSYSNVQRGWNGTPVQFHSSGATVVLGGDQLFVQGTNAIYRDFEIRNSNPVRTQIPANTQNSPHLRGEGVFIVGPANSFVNLVIHDCQEGIFNGNTGVGTTIYGCIIYNNGYVAGGAFNGHGVYVLHSDTAKTLHIKESVVFNNSNIGIKNDSQNGNAVNIWHEGDVSFNNGSWAQGVSRHWQLLAASNNGVADDITVKDCFFFVPSGIAGEQLRLGIGRQANGHADVTGNYIVGGTQTMTIESWQALTFTDNILHSSGGSNAQMVNYLPLPGAKVTWDNNTYWNQITQERGYLYDTGNPTSVAFSAWKAASGFDTNSDEETGALPSPIAFVRANAYDVNRGHIIIYNLGKSHEIKVDVSSLLQRGQRYELQNVQDLTGSPVLAGKYKGKALRVPMTGLSVVSPVGYGSDFASTAPEFAVFILRIL
jgi:hypothetical protein